MADTSGWTQPSVPAPGDNSHNSHGSQPPQGQQPQWGQPPQYGQQTQWTPPPRTAAPWGWASPPPEFKPGIVPLRPLSVGELLDGGFATVRRHPRVAFGFAAVFAALLELARVLTGAAMRDVRGGLGAMYTTTRSTDTDPLPTYHFHDAAVASTIVEYVLSGVFAVLLAGVVTVVVSKAILGEPIAGAEVGTTVRRRGWRLLGVGLIAGLGPFAPMLVVGLLGVLAAFAGNAALAATLIIGIPVSIATAVWLWGKLALAVPAFMLERLGVTAAIGRSWRLVRGAFWRTWGLRALVTLIVGVASSVVSLVFVLIAGLVGGGFSFFSGSTDEPIAALIVMAVGSAIVWAITQPLLAATLTLIYVDRRIRAEGLDIALTRAAQAGRAGMPTGSY
jgi:hypothetical protein